MYNDTLYMIVEMANGEQMLAFNSSYTPKKPIVNRNLKNNEFIPIIIYKDYGKIYKCPCCGMESGTLAPQLPQRTELFQHTQFPYCENTYKIPVEN
jgi:hypothetical protein